MASPILMDKENRDDHKVLRAAKATSGNVTRKGLTDISNLPERSRSFVHEVKSNCTVKEWIDELLEQNISLKKLLVERNQIIESRGLELHKLHISMQKVQLQNIQLAQANSQLLAEHNKDKDRLKTLQHELACINGVLKAWQMEMVGKGKGKRCQDTNNGEEIITAVKVDGSPELENCDNKACPTSRRRKRQSLDPSTTKQVQAKMKADNKRPCRRQSARFKSIEPENFEEFPETNEANRVQALKNSDNTRNLSTSQSGRDDSTEPGCTLQSFGIDNANQDQKNEEYKERPSTSRRQSGRFKAREPAPNEELFETDNVKQVQAKEKETRKRHSSRRQSARFNTSETECTVKLSESDDIDHVQPKESEDKKSFKPGGHDCTEEFSQTDAAKEVHACNKRNCSRRQSARLKCIELECTDDIFETDDFKFSVSTMSKKQMQERDSTSLAKEDKEKAASEHDIDVKRHSIGRPSRRAAERVQSYKEVSLRVKMRRS